ncbi:MAG: hypothetical protein JW793_04950 [Acidobacteria bacterium]|nr:hypothetical protein [Acidobacteriota bacterium]
MTTLRNISLVIIIIGIFIGVRYIGSVIHYGCHREPIVNVDGGDDCPPPFWVVGQLGFYLTGGSFNPLFNRDAITVSKVSWHIEKADPSFTIRDDLHFYEQRIAADITTYDGRTKRYDLGTAHGCAAATASEHHNRTIVIGRVKCSFAESATTFAAYKGNGGFRIERSDESAKDGGIRTTTPVEIKK